MKNVFRSQTSIQMAGVCILAAVLLAWQPGSHQSAKQSAGSTGAADTSAPRSRHSDQIDIQLNLDSVMQEVNLALSNINFDKMNADIQKAMADVDYQKINADIQNAMQNINWNEMKVNVDLALDSAKLALQQINWDEMKSNIRKAQEEARRHINSDSIRLQVEKAMQNAQLSLQKAQTEIQNYKGLISALEKDGLIDTGKPYKVQLKDGSLYLNGKKQTGAITEKYKRFYSGKKNFSIGENSDDHSAGL